MKKIEGFEVSRHKGPSGRGGVKRPYIVSVKRGSGDNVCEEIENRVARIVVRSKGGAVAAGRSTPVPPEKKK